MLEISEEVVRGVATICGPHSAAANALKDAETRRSRGEFVTFYKERGRLIVHGVLVTTQVERVSPPTHQPAPQTSGKERADLAKAEHIEWREEEARLALVHAAGCMPGRGARARKEG